MKKTVFLVFRTILFASILIACTGNEKGITLDDSPVVAHIDEKGVVVLNLSSVRDTIDMPMSALFSEFEIIRLENSDDAITGEGIVWVSEKYIGIYSWSVGAYKLYDRTGKYLGDITKRGQGPNEFVISLYDSHIDETEGKINVLSGRATKIMVFDLQGNPLEPIPLPFVVHKGRMKINAKEQTLVMLALPFANTPYAAWKQDFNGNILQSIPADQYVLKRDDYSNEIGETFNTNSIAYYLTRVVPETDTLYHYDVSANAMIPRFTANFPPEVKLHDYNELSNYYVFRMVVMHSLTGTNRSPMILIDKQTLKGAYVRWQLDMLGNIFGANFVSFNRGYYTACVHPASFKEQLEAALEKENLSDEMRKKLTELNSSITDDDNNIVLIGKLK